MSDATWERLRERFTEKYGSFRARLRKRFGSDDLAQEALHETWLRLLRGVGGGDERPATPVRQPDSYLFAMCLNMAKSLIRNEARHTSQLEIDAAFELADEAARPAEAVESRLALEELERAMRDLPPRQRTILLAVRVHETPISDVAKKLRLSRRTVKRELNAALEYCAAQMEISPETHVPQKPPKASKN